MRLFCFPKNQISMRNLKYLQKLFFLLVMGFLLCAVQACSSDDEPIDEPVVDPSKNTTDIAVTGLIESCGYTTARINGYVNLDKLFPGSEGVVNWGVIGAVGIKIGVQATPSSGGYSHEKTTNSTERGFCVELSELLPQTKYKYRTFVKYGEIYHYGEYRTFTTKDLNIIKSGAVDLGLSVKWAACNVGASYPQEYGGYYAWGETEENNDYSWDTYKWYKWHPLGYGPSGNMTKYSHYGTTEEERKYCDYKTTLEVSDDVARVKLGGNWRMPTESEIEELCDKCICLWTTYGGVNGFVFIGSNDNCIFLPAAGARIGTDFNGRGSHGYYWSATLSDLLSNKEACGLHFEPHNIYNWNRGDRYKGRSVRPVTD